MVVVVVMGGGGLKVTGRDMAGNEGGETRGSEAMEGQDEEFVWDTGTQ